MRPRFDRYVSVLLVALMLMPVAAFAKKKPKPISLEFVEMVEGRRFGVSMFNRAWESDESDWEIELEWDENGELGMPVIVRDDEDPVEVELPLKQKRATIELSGMKRDEAGNILVAGNVVSDLNPVPCIWLHRVGTPPDQWEQIPLRTSLMAKEGRRKMDTITQVMSFERDTELLIVGIVTLNRRLSMAKLDVTVNPAAP